MKKFFSMILILMLTMSFSTAVFATEPENMVDTKYDVSSRSDRIAPVSARSSISGYASYTVGTGSGTVGSVIIPVDSSGIGGAGATITTSSSSTYATTVRIYEVDGPIFSKRLMKESKISSNGTYYFENMTHYQPQYIVIEFDTIQTNINVQAWIYG